jgi:CheY-like chemotaxis protein
MEQQLRQAQKMEAIGTLAGGIAHDFNNILTAILGFSELSIEDSPPNSTASRNMQHVLRAAERARNLVKQILTFSRQSETEKKPVEINLIVKEAMKLIRSTIPSTIEIQKNIAHESSMVLADSTQIHQVVMNLCANASYAMKDNGGLLQVDLKNIRLEINNLPLSNMIPGDYVQLSIIDTGHGILPEIRERIFEPYFTTKKPDEGTGLGLSVVHGIIKDHGGEIIVSSELGKGTKFDIYLPQLNNEINLDDTTPSYIPGGNETILFVDDEKALTDVGEQLLERMGYNVVARTSSMEAFTIFKQNPDHFDLIITDLTMPTMTGIQLAMEVKKIRNNIPIILCTGFSEKTNLVSMIDIGIQQLISKPFIKNDIAKAIRQVLDKKTISEYQGIYEL